jgi:peptide/nickel transport system substrate-binding protein
MSRAKAPKHAWSVLSTQFLAISAGLVIIATVFALLGGLLATSSFATAQDAKAARLIDQPPFDLLILDKANDNKVLKIAPLNLPGRQVPKNPKGTDRIKIKLLDSGVEYEVAWANIAKLELFEQMVLAEANQLTADGKFDEAYGNFVFLLDFYPKLAGLAEARQHYLYLSAGAAFRQKKYDEALAILEELLTQNPSYQAPGSAPPILQVLGNIADPILAGYLDKRDYRAARTLLARLSKQHKAENEKFARDWREKLEELAAVQRDAARQHLDAARFVEAYDACRAMEQIWPELPGAAELIAAIASRHPLVRVGVEHPALAFDSTSLNDVAARRSGRLTQRLLVERTGLGTDGGQYESPLGTLTPSDDRLALVFHLSPTAGAGGALEVAQQLLARAEPLTDRYLPAWGRIVAAVRVQEPSDVEVRLRSPHVLPAALLQEPLGAPTTGGKAGRYDPFTVLSKDDKTIRFTANADYAFRRPGQPAEIVERYFDDPQRLLVALKQGELDLVDCIFPGDIAALQADQRFVVAPYQLPTTHVLVIRSANPFLANRSFRRALLYGCNRELLLAQGLLRGKALPGFRVVSSPFPAPSPTGDVPAYGYDRQIEPRPYDPRLGLTLRLLAEGEVKAAFQQKKEEPPKLTSLILGHPADETSRIACRGLKAQWKQIGIDCTLAEFAPGVFDDAQKKCDLVYMQLAAWEPIVDASRLLGTHGLAPGGSSFVQLALRQIEQARNWQEARTQLLHLHRLLHEDVTLLPLWQTMDHFAYRRTLQGLTPRRLRLYQDVEQWQAAAQIAESKP